MAREEKEADKLNLNMSNLIKHLQTHHSKERNGFTVIREERLARQLSIEVPEQGRAAE